MLADRDTDVLAIPAASLLDATERNPVTARDVRALPEARRVAIQSLKRSLHAVA